MRARDQISPESTRFLRLLRPTLLAPRSQQHVSISIKAIFHDKYFFLAHLLTTPRLFGPTRIKSSCKIIHLFACSHYLICIFVSSNTCILRSVNINDLTLGCQTSDSASISKFHQCHVIQIFTTGPCLPCLWRQCCIRVTQRI